MNRDLFLAILSMDSYNRGYGQGVNNLPDLGSVGTAVIKDIPLPAGSVQTGFYAIAYDVSGVSGLSGTVIAYRGTDDPLPDLVNGYGVGAGRPYGEQARLSVQFYNAVTGRAPESGIHGNAAVMITGHSLGGGLAVNDNGGAAWRAAA